MLIGGLIPFSLVDFPGKFSCILFTIGCNFRCPFCYNKDLVFGNIEPMSLEKIFEWLETRKGKLEGVTITGGEPTLHKDLPEFIERIKGMGFAVKLDTNGSNPDMLRRVIDLVDYVAMDVKAGLVEERYRRATGIEGMVERVKESIRIIMSSNVPYEFRTTLVPGIVDEFDIKSIGEHIRGARLWALQQYRPENTIDPTFQNIKPYLPSKARSLAELASQYVEKVIVRGL